MSDIEREMEEMLHRVLDPIAARPIPARRAPASRSVFKTVMGGAGAALTVKVLTGVAAAAAAVTVAGVVTTGTLDPAHWGEQVSHTVQTCKDDIANSSQHGIGDCVSDFANQHGALVSSEARHHGIGGSNGSGNGNGNANDHSKDKGKDHPVPTPPASHRVSPGPGQG